MLVGDCCNRPVVSIRSTESLHHAARLMREHHVGDVVVVAPSGSGLRPVGILTDRDLTIEILATESDPELVCVGDLVGDGVTVVGESEELETAITTMAQAGVRRMPVVGSTGELVGILSLDDVLGVLAKRMADVAGLVAGQPQTEARLRP